MILKSLKLNEISYKDSLLNIKKSEYNYALADDIKTNGIKIPIIVIKHLNQYKLIDGFLRIKIAENLAYDEINCFVIDCKSDHDLFFETVISLLHSEKKFSTMQICRLCVFAENTVQEPLKKLQCSSLNHILNLNTATYDKYIKLSRANSEIISYIEKNNPAISIVNELLLLKENWLRSLIAWAEHWKVRPVELLKFIKLWIQAALRLNKTPEDYWKFIIAEVSNELTRSDYLNQISQITELAATPQLMNNLSKIKEIKTLLEKKYKLKIETDLNLETTQSEFKFSVDSIAALKDILQKINNETAILDIKKIFDVIDGEL